MRQLDASAQRLLDLMVTTHRGLKRYAATITSTARAGKRTETVTVTVSYRKPATIRIEGVRPDGRRILSTSDGKLRQVGPNKTKAEVGERALIAALQDADFLIAPVFLHLVSALSPAKSLLPGTVKVLGMGIPQVIDGTPVEVVAADVATPKGTARLTFSIGKTDHLLHRLEVETADGDEPLLLTELYAKIQA